MARFIVEISNVNAGAGNPAYTVHHLANNTSTQEFIAAQLIAFSQYQSCATGTSVTNIFFSAANTGGTLPLGFPVGEYNTMSLSDAFINPMTGYGTAFGSGGLAVLGAGAVLREQSATPGRSGRGRITTPWLSQNAVTAAGTLGPGQQATLIDGYNCYLRNVGRGTRSTAIADLLPFVLGAGIARPITSVSTTPRLGRLRSRTA